MLRKRWRCEAVDAAKWWTDQRTSTKEIEVSLTSAHDPQLERLADAIAQRVGPQRFSVWFNNSTRLDLKQDELEIAVPNDFISDWIVRHFAKTIQEAAHEVLGCSLSVRFNVVPQLFVGIKEDDLLDNRMKIGGSSASRNGNGHGHANGNGHGGHGNGHGKANGARVAVGDGH